MVLDMSKLNLDKLIGKKVKRIFMNEDFLQFVTEPDEGAITFTVEGDCCSQSVFYDFIGVKKLLESGEITQIKEVHLDPTDIVQKKTEYGDIEQSDNKSYQECISVYGYSITSVHPQWGEVTSVFSFRNYSNGYYGGWMEDCHQILNVEPEIFDDVIEIVPEK